MRYAGGMESIETEVVDSGGKRDERGRRIVSAAERERILAEYAASGLTQSAFARREGLAYGTFVAWLGRQKREGAAKRPSPVRFEQVHLESAASGALVEVRLPNGMMVRGAAVAPVAELVRALRD